MFPAQVTHDQTHAPQGHHRIFLDSGRTDGPGAVHAQLFGDDEARKAIIDLRERVEVQRKQTESRLRMEVCAHERRVWCANPAPCSTCGNQMEGCARTSPRLRGQSEQLARDVADGSASKKTRWWLLMSATAAGAFHRDRGWPGFQVRPRKGVRSRPALVRKASFAQAATAFASFIKRYPQSGYQPLAYFWRAMQIRLQ